MRESSSAAARAASRFPAATSISTCASRRGARRSSVFGGTSFEGTFPGRSRASRMDAAASATSPWARCTRASPGCGSHPASCAATNAASAPWTSPLRRRMRPSSVSGHPSSRRKYGRSSSQASERFLLRFDPRPSQPEDLGAVNPAASVDAPHGLSLPPALHRFRPLARPGRIARALAARTRPRNRRSRWRGDRAHRRPPPFPLRRGARVRARRRLRGSGCGPRRRDRWRRRPARTSFRCRSRGGPTAALPAKSPESSRS